MMARRDIESLHQHGHRGTGWQTTARCWGGWESNPKHIRHQASLVGDVMVLVWKALIRAMWPRCWPTCWQNLQSEHERYIATHVIPDLQECRPIGTSVDDAESRDDRDLRRSVVLRARCPLTGSWPFYIAESESVPCITGPLISSSYPSVGSVDSVTRMLC